MKTSVVNLYTGVQTKVLSVGFFQTAEKVHWVKGGGCASQSQFV